MSLPRFFSRVSDAITPLLGADNDASQFLEGKSVRLDCPPDIERHQYHVAGLLLLANLCARLYPEIRVVGPVRIVEQCRAVVLSINPECRFVAGEGNDEASARVAWACKSTAPEMPTVAPMGWEVLIDLPDASRIHKTNILAALGAAVIAASELFRQVFSDYLPKGRKTRTPGRFNFLTQAPTQADLPDLPSDIPLGRVHLVGAGAVGQAAAYALARVSAAGTLVVIDPEPVTLSNLQRYVLTTDVDVGASKCALVERAFAKTRRIETLSVEGPWTIDHAYVRDAEVVCVAVDSEETRIAIQGSLPRTIYNAWTQPADIGWSRHERFGSEPCLACLYWPTGPRPSFHENVARSIRQHELRVLTYLIGNIPVDRPLLPGQIPKLAQYPIPAEASGWSERSLLEAIASELGVPADEASRWNGRLLTEVYRDGICAGALVRRQLAEVPTEMAVPLAHQSVLAGVMLAVQVLVASHPDLQIHRSKAIEARLDLLSGFPQQANRPRQRTPGCLCNDVDYQERYYAKWSKGMPSVS